MAIAPVNEEAFLREVDDELRRSQLEGFWRRWGRWLVVALVAGLALLGGFLYWQHRQREAAGVKSEQLSQALADLAQNNQKAATPKLDALAAGGGAYGAVARLTAAGVASVKADTKAAAAGFGAVATDESVAEPLQQLALIRQTAAEFQTLPPATTIARLEPIARPGSPWYGSAGEMVAVSYVRLGQPAKAAAILAAIAKADQVPQSIKARAARLSTALGATGVAPAAQPPAGLPKE